MTTPHPHLELARRIMPLAAYVREYDVDGTLAEVAVRGLGEFLGLEVVIVDPDPGQRLDDLGRGFQRQLRSLLHHPGTHREALRVGLDVADQVVALLRDSVAQQGRRWRRQPVRRLQVGG